MPIYEYQCQKCGKKFEILQSLNDDGSKVRCPQCQAEKPQRFFSVFGSTAGDSSGGSCSSSSFT